MARLVTLEALRELIRDRGEWRSTYITDTQLSAWISDACFKFYSLMSEVDPWRYLVKEDIAVSSGTKEYDLPSDFYRLLGVALADATADGYSVLESFSWEERYDDTYVSDNASTRYMVHGSGSSTDIDHPQHGNYVIEFQPTPTWSGTVRVEYVPQFYDLTQGTDKFDTINGLGEEWIICDVAVKACAKEESDPSVYTSQKAEAEKLLIRTGVQDSTKPRPSSTAETLRDLQLAVRNRGTWSRSDVPDAKLTEFINGSIATLRDLVCKRDPSHFVSYDEISVVSGTRTYNLATNFYKCVGVDVVDSGASDGYAVMKQFNWEERYDDTYTVTQSNTRYHIRGNQIHFHPTPNWTDKVRVEYIPKYTALVNPTDTFDTFNHWHEFIILDACIKTTISVGKDPAAYAAQKAEAEKRIASFAAVDIHDQKRTSTSGTLENLQLAVRNRGGWSRDDITDSQLTEWINSSIGGLVDVMSAFNPTYFLSTNYDVLDGNTDTYALPSDFYKAISVSVDFDDFTGSYMDLTGDGYYGLEQCSWAEFIDFREGAYGAVNTTQLRWTVRGDNIHFTPRPIVSGSDGYAFRLDYIANPTTLANPSDTVSFPNNWIEWAILDSAVKAASFTGKDPAPFLAQQEKIEGRISKFSKRDLSENLVPRMSFQRYDSIMKSIRSRGKWDSSAITNFEINSLMNSSVMRLQNFIASVNPTYFYTESFISVSSGVRKYELPTDFNKLLGLSYYDASLTDGYAVMQSFEWSERFGADSTSTMAGTRYALQGGFIWLQPTPTWSGTVRLEYVRFPQATNVNSGRTVRTLFDGEFWGENKSNENFGEQNFWVEWIMEDVASKIATAMKQDPAPFITQRGDVEKQIREFFDTRDLSKDLTTSTSGTLQTLQRSVRGRGGWKREDFTDTQLTEWINSSISGLRNVLIQIDPTYFVTYEDIVVNSGDREYELPSDFLKAVGVDAYDSTLTDGYQALNHFNWSERYDVATSSKLETRYHIRGGNLYLQPTPTWSGTVRLEYIPTFSGLTAPDDTVSLYDNWQEWVTLDCAIKCAAAKGTDTQVFGAQQQKVEERIKSIATQNAIEQTTPSTEGTLGNLQLTIRARGSWDKEKINDSQLTAWINSSISGLRNMLIQIDPTYFVSYEDIAVSSGDREYALPSDFLKAVGVDAYDSSITDGYQALNHFNWSERYDVATSSKLETRYHIRGGNLYLHPAPDWDGVVRLEYVPTFAGLVNPSDTVSLYDNWQEWVTLDCAIKCAAAKGTDPQVFMAQQQKVEERIKSIATQNAVDQTTPSTEGTLGNLQLTIRARGGWDKEKINDSQLTAWINSSISGLRDTICEVDNSYFLTYEDISVVAGTREYDLPSTFFKLVGIDAYDSALADEYQSLNHFNWSERYDNTYVGTKDNTRYHIRGNTLHLHPTPTWGGTVRLEYIPTYTNLVNPSDTVSLYNNWQEYVVLDCCIKCSALVGTDPQAYMAQLQKVEQGIVKFAKRNLADQTTPSTSTTLQNLQLAARGRGNWDKDTINDSQLTEWIESSIAAFYDLVVMQDDSFFLSYSDINVVSGTKGYSLPSDFYKVKGVSVRDSSNADGYATLNRYDYDERYDYSLQSNNWQTRYIITGQEIQFHPIPNWSGVVRLEYIPLPTAMDDPADTFRFVNHWQEYVILSTAIKACSLVKEDAGAYIAQLRAVEKRIIRSAEQDVGKAKTVVDVYRGSKYRWWH